MKYLYTLILCFACCFTQAQAIDSNLTAFNKSLQAVGSKLSYALQDCTATFAILRIDIDAQNNVSEIYFSDSIDSLVNNQFNILKEQLDLSALNRYVKINNYKSTELFIPFMLIKRPVDCKEPSKEKIYLDYLFRFNKELYIGQATLLSHIYLSVISRH